MIAYHGTTQENKVNILKEGFRFDTEIKQGKLFGDAIYFTTRKKRAEDYGLAIIEVEIDVENIMFFEFKDEYDDFFESFVEEVLHPFKSIEEFILDIVNANKEEYIDLPYKELEKLINPIVKNTEYKVGTAIRNWLISQGYTGLALLMGDADIDYYEITVYDAKTIIILC